MGGFVKKLKVLIVSLICGFALLQFAVANQERADIEAQIADVQGRIESYEKSMEVPGLDAEVRQTIEENIVAAQEELKRYQAQLEQLDD